MSDINDLIATNSINSFNIGYQTGVRQEQKRIMELLEKNFPRRLEAIKALIKESK